MADKCVSVGISQNLLWFRTELIGDCGVSPGLDWQRGDKAQQLLLQLKAGIITWRHTARETQTEGGRDVNNKTA